MTSRERVMTALEHKITDRVPFTWGNGIADETLRMVGEYLHTGSIEQTRNLPSLIIIIRSLITWWSS